MNRRIIPLGEHSVFLVPPEMEHLFRKPWYRRLRLRLFFDWRDIWIGLFIDTRKQCLYFCPLPCVGMKFSWGVTC